MTAPFRIEPIKPSPWRTLPGFEIYQGDDYVTISKTEDDARRYIEVLQTALPEGTRVRASSGFLGAILGISMDYHTGEVQYMVKPDNVAVSWWGSSLENTQPL